MDSENLLSLLGQRIRLLRETKGWSQEELAHRCGRHFTYIGRVERGKQNITIKVLFEIAQALAVSVQELLSVESESHPLLDRWNVTATDILEAIDHGFRAQVDVKGKLAEWMLYKELQELKVQGAINNIVWQDADSKPDFIVTARRRKIVIECKNVRSTTSEAAKNGLIRVELQKTRNSKDGTNTRGYSKEHFDVLSACLFNTTGKWDFVYIAINNLETRPGEPSILKVMHNVPLPTQEPWRISLPQAIEDRFR